MSALGLLLFAGLGMNGGNCNVNVPGGSTGNTGNTGSTGNVANVVILAGDHVKGDANAKVTVVEYGDFECPFCGRFSRQEFPTIQQQFIDTGMVRWVFRHFPLRNIHPRAEPAARASECANDQGMFFPYHDLLYGTVTPGTGDVILTDDQLRQHAQTLGMDLTAFDACFPPGNAKAARVQTDVNSGTALGITATPTFFVNGEQVTGFQTAQELGEVINRHLSD